MLMSIFKNKHLKYAERNYQILYLKFEKKKFSSNKGINNHIKIQGKNIRGGRKQQKSNNSINEKVSIVE